MPFSPEIRTRVLLWCDRRCCLCGRACGANIEVHHVDPRRREGREDIDNAIPLCFDCHADVLKYNVKHPKGNKITAKELKARREQVYEEYTRHLVPPIDYRVTQSIPGAPFERKLPDVGFILTHLGDSLPVRVRVRATLILNGRRLRESLGPHYHGERLWRLNPRVFQSGHFNLPTRAMPPDGKRIEIEVAASIIDGYEREHALLPVGWVCWVENGKAAWYFEP